ncbi:MAG: oligosaccharide flippase family protein, partial [Pseudomonadota bacterium]
MLGKKVAVATTVLMIGTVIANVIGFASMIIVARHLAPEDFGLAITALAIVLIIGALTDLPVSTSLYHLKTPSDDDFNTAWTLSLLRGLVAMLVLLAMAYPLSALYEDARLVPLIAALSIMPLGFSLRSMYFERYAMDLNFTPSIVERVFQKLASALTAIAIATTTASYWAIPVSMIVASFASLLITYVYAPRLPRLSLKSFKAIFGYSIWLSLAGMFNAITWRIEILTAGKLIGPAGAGYIGLGAQFTSRFREFAVGPIRQSLFSAFSKMQEDPARLRVAYGASMATSLALLAPIGVGMSLLSGSIDAGAHFSPKT